MLFPRSARISGTQQSAFLGQDISTFEETAFGYSFQCESEQARKGGLLVPSKMLV